jgi:hypothetical protein
MKKFKKLIKTFKRVVKRTANRTNCGKAFVAVGALAVLIVGLNTIGLSQTQPNGTPLTVTVTTGTVTLAIPLSSECRISNQNTGGSPYGGTVAVTFKPSLASASTGSFKLWPDDGVLPVVNFIPSAGASTYWVYPGDSGKLIFTGSGSSGSSVLNVDCSQLPPSRLFTPQPPILDGVTGFYGVTVEGTPNVNVANASIPMSPQPYPGVSPTPKIGVWVDCVYSSPSPAPNPTASPGAELTPPCDVHGIPYAHLFMLDPCRDPTYLQQHAILNMTTATTTTIISGSVNTLGEYICHIQTTVAAVDTMSVGYSTHANACASGVTAISQTYQLSLGFIDSYWGTLYPGASGPSVPANDDTCITNGSAVNLGVDMWYIFHV